MRISHGELEACRRNPRSWVAQKINPLSGGPRTGYDGATKLAIYKFHKTNNETEARQYLQDLIERLDFKKDAYESNAMTKLNSYIDWYHRESPLVAFCKLRLNFDLGSNLILGGEISRIDVDVNSDRYFGIIIGNRPSEWQSQLRTPLIQRALAIELQRGENNISVGFQDVEGSQLEVITYSKKILNEAENTARRLAETLANEWRRQGGK